MAHPGRFRCPHRFVWRRAVVASDDGKVADPHECQAGRPRWTYRLETPVASADTPMTRCLREPSVALKEAIGTSVCAPVEGGYAQLIPGPGNG